MVEGVKAPEGAPSAEDVLANARAVPQIYFNGFQIGLSNADVALLGLLDNQPVVKINVSYTTAKTLVVKLSAMMKTFEDATGREIMTTDDAGNGLEGISRK